MKRETRQLIRKAMKSEHPLSTALLTLTCERNSDRRMRETISTLHTIYLEERCPAARGSYLEFLQRTERRPT